MMLFNKDFCDIHRAIVYPFLFSLKAIRIEYNMDSPLTLSLRLERTREFLIYGHSQQRRAVIEAMRLFEKENSKQIHDHPKLDDLDDLNLPHLKDKSKKWQNFVSQVTTFTCLM